MHPSSPAAGAKREVRSQRRHALQVFVPFQLELLSGTALDTVYVDVSERGLGIFLMAGQIQCGGKLHLVLDSGERIEMRVCWLRQDLQEPGLKGFIRAGLAVVATSVDLLTHFRAHGCVEDEA